MPDRPPLAGTVTNGERDRRLARQPLLDVQREKRGGFGRALVCQDHAAITPLGIEERHAAVLGDSAGVPVGSGSFVVHPGQCDAVARGDAGTKLLRQSHGRRIGTQLRIQISQQVARGGADGASGCEGVKVPWRHGPVTVVVRLDQAVAGFRQQPGGGVAHSQRTRDAFCDQVLIRHASPHAQRLSEQGETQVAVVEFRAAPAGDTVLRDGSVKIGHVVVGESGGRAGEAAAVEIVGHGRQAGVVRRQIEQRDFAADWLARPCPRATVRAAARPGAPFLPPPSAPGGAP